jgi:hypothetical protein
MMKLFLYEKNIHDNSDMASRDLDKQVKAKEELQIHEQKVGLLFEQRKKSTEPGKGQKHV